MSQRNRIIVLLGLFLLILPVAYFSPFRQIYRIKKADKHAAYLKEVISNNPKYKKVEFGSFTADMGCLAVVGVVSSKEDLRELKKIVLESNPPVSVQWVVQVENNLSN